MRDKFNLQFRCAKHPEQVLEIDSKLCKKHYSSAYKGSTDLYLKPCIECSFEHDQFKMAVEIIVKEKSK